VRLGALSEERYLLAAFCGYPAAVRSPGQERPAILSEHARQWLAGEKVDLEAPMPSGLLKALPVDVRVALAAIHAAAPPRTATERDVRQALTTWLLAGAHPLGVPHTERQTWAATATDLLVEALGYVSQIHMGGPRSASDGYRVRWLAAVETAR